jgi:probable F420-dependent oxidoreductase
MPRLGVKVPVLGRQPVDPGLREIAAVAEDAGADALWISDHIVITERTDSRYPYSSDGSVAWEPDTDCIESLTACTWLASATKRVSVGTAVLVLPQRDPILLAKTAVTIDWLSGGRFVLGVGAGWYAEEFAALGWDFATRGRRMNEAIDVLRACWSGRPQEFEGEFFSLPAGMHCFPMPVRSSGVPLFIGGMAKVSLDRVARLGDGWVALTRWDALDADDLARKLEYVHTARPAGMASLQTVLRITGAVELDQVDACLAALRRLAALGFDEVSVDPDWGDLAAARELISRVADGLA